MLVTSVFSFLHEYFLYFERQILQISPYLKLSPEYASSNFCFVQGFTDVNRSIEMKTLMDSVDEDEVDGFDDDDDGD